MVTAPARCTVVRDLTEHGLGARRLGRSADERLVACGTRGRRRRKIPVADRYPLVRPAPSNDVWSADFTFDRTAEGRVVKCVTNVNDPSREVVAIVPARTLVGLPATCVLDRRAHERDPPQILRADNGPEFCRRAMRTWAHDCGAKLGLIETWRFQ